MITLINQTNFHFSYLIELHTHNRYLDSRVFERSDEAKKNKKWLRRYRFMAHSFPLENIYITYI